MTIKIASKLVSFLDLMKNEALNPQVQYEILNIDIENVVERFLNDNYHLMGEDTLNGLKFNIHSHISIFGNKINKDTKENAIIFIKQEFEKKLQSELKYLKLLDVDRSFITKIILKNDIEKVKEKTNIIKNVLGKIQNMSLGDFEKNFVIEHKSYNEKDIFIIPNYDFKPKRIYYSIDKAEVGKGLLFPTETRVYGGFKDENGMSKIEFQYSLSSKGKDDIYINVKKENDDFFYFKPRTSSIMFFENKEEAIKVVEESLNKSWKRLKKIKKDPNF